MITRTIAKNGMKGRKKVSALLILVLSFTFLFIVAAILLETSMSETKQDQRCRLYGAWQAAYLGATPKVQEKLLKEPELSAVGVSEILGKDAQAGTVGSFQEELAEIGNLKLQQGSFPQADNEVLIEANVADALGLEEPVGANITLTIRNSLIKESMAEFLSREGEKLYETQKGLGGYARRQLMEREQKDGITLTLESRYCFISGMDTGITPEEIEKNGLLYEQDITFAKEYVICGVIDSYSAFWDTGNFPVTNVFLSESGAEQVKQMVTQTKLKDLSAMEFPSNIFCVSEVQKEGLYQTLEADYGTEEELRSSAAFRRNTYAYPVSGGSMEEGLTLLVVAVIFVVAFCAILQIFMTQMKHRVRKLALLKSIGTTSGQICGILLWEGAYLLLYSMPAGVALGFAGGYGAVKLLNRFGGMELTFYCNPGMVLLGIGAGCLALLAGMAVPMIQAVRVPLVGTISAAGNRKSRNRSRTGSHWGRKKVQGSSAAASDQNSSGYHKCGSPSDHGKKKQEMLTFRKISRAHRKLNWKNRVLTGAITVVTSMILFSSLYLGYASFDTYITKVVEGNRPNYVLSAPHGYEKHDLKMLKEQIDQELSGAEIASYQQMNKIYLQYEGIQDSPLIQSYKELLPKERYKEFIGDEPSPQEKLRGCQEDLSMILGSICTTLYTVDTADDIYEEMKEMVTEGEVDDTSFIQGNSVILAIPMYRQKDTSTVKQTEIPERVADNEMFSYVLTNLGNYELSYQKRDAGQYQKDMSLQPGDTVQISRMKEVVAEKKPPISYITVDAQAAGIIYYTPTDRPYPFFENENGYTVIASSGFFTRFSPDALYNPALVGTDQQGNLGQFEFLLSQCPTQFGETHLNVYTKDGANAVDSASKVIKAGKSYGMDFQNYNEENWNLYFRALNTAVMLGILGGTSLVIALMILWNINMSAFEQERRRIGILQALGVTDREISRDYLLTGMKNGMLALAVTHGVLAGMMFFTQGVHWNLYLYPWTSHILLCAGFFLLVTAVNCGSCVQLKKYSPNENIMA